MGLFDRISKALATASPFPPTSLARVDPRVLSVRGEFDPARLPDWLGQRTADWSPWDDTAQLADAVRKCTVVFACATFLADAVAESPLEVYKKTGTEKDVATDRVAGLCRDLLTTPNPYTSGSEFLLTLVMGMGVWGYGVLEKVRMKGSLDLPVQLWTLRPDWLQRRQRANSTERYWQYPKPGGGFREIEDRDILFVPYYPDPWRNSYGISPAQVAAREIGIDSSLTDFLKTFLDAGGIPPFVLTHPDPIYDPATITAMQELWRQKYGGSKAYGSLPVLHGGYKLEQIGGSVDEMAWPDLRGLTEQKIAQAHRVPLELIQGQMALSGGPLTSTQFDGAMTVLQRYGAAPLRSRIDAVFTRGVLAEFTGGDPSYDLAFDTAGILALQEDQDAKHTRIRADVGGVPLMTLNEGRRAIGLDELPNGDVFAIAFSVTLTPADQLVPTETTTTTPPPVPPPAKSVRVYRDTKALIPRDLEVRASSLSRTRKDRNKLTEIGSRALRKFWTEQGKRVTSAVVPKARWYEEVSAKTAKPDWQEAIDQALHDLRVAEPIDWPAEERALALVLLRFYHANGEAAFKAIAELLDAEIDWTLANPNIQRVVSDLARRIVGIAEETRRQVTETIDAALSEGVTTQELADRLTGLFEQTYRNRAEAVARTESMVAYNRASVVGYAESGEVEEVELADNPSHTDSYGASDGLTCAERHGLVVKLEAVETHINAEHPNGSLAVIPILSTPLGE